MELKVEYMYTCVAGTVIYLLYSACWRLWLSPISQFPGPRLAALTSLYEAYYNIWLGGKYIYKIQQLHEQYGPIIRISPRDLHVSDPDFYEVLYPSASSGRRADKEPGLTKFFGLDDSLFSTMDHDLHRMRRAALLPFFSTAYVRKMQPEFQERLDVLLARMLGFRDTGAAVNANCMFAAFSNDITHMLAFGQCAKKLETPDFDSQDRDASLSGAQSIHVMKRVPWFNNLMMSLPEAVTARLSAPLGQYMRQKASTRQHVERLASGIGIDGGEDMRPEKEQKEPLFRAVMASPKLPAHERAVARVAQDAQMLLMAGTLTMASNLEHLVYWLVDNPDVLAKLKAELVTVMPSIEDVGKVPLTALEALPYMTAVIKESVRLIYGNSTPHFRVCPDQALEFRPKEGSPGGKKVWTIPPGTSVGMTSVLLHHDETNFPDSYRFLPERWLGESGKKLDRYMVGFGKGSRICVGMNQAYGVLRLVLAQTWRLWASPGARIGDEIGVLSLYNTSKHDVTMNGDFFVAAYNKPQGVEFKLTRM